MGGKTSKGDRELREIRELLGREASLERNFLVEQREIIHPDYFLSRLLICSARFGTYDLKKLKLVGAALELLELALRKHYNEYRAHRPSAGEIGKTSRACRQAGEESSKRHKTGFSYNLRLITGDYYYARAILLVESLGKVVVRTLAGAIASFAGAYAHQNSFGESDKSPQLELRKVASLYEASCTLGCYLSSVPKKIASHLIEFGLNVGVVRILKQDRLLVLGLKVRENLTRRYFILAKEALQKIPEQAVVREDLYNLLTHL